MSARVLTTYMAGYANMDILILDLPFLRSTSPSCFQATNQQWETDFAICVWTLQPSIPWFGFRDFRWCGIASNSVPTDKKSDFLADVASTTNAIGLRAWFVVNIEKHRCSRLWIRMNYWLHSYYRLSTTESSRLVHAEHNFQKSWAWRNFIDQTFIGYFLKYLSSRTSNAHFLVHVYSFSNKDALFVYFFWHVAF